MHLIYLFVSDFFLLYDDSPSYVDGDNKEYGSESTSERTPGNLQLIIR